MVNEIPEEYFDVEKEGQVEIIGWLYQYYNEEPHDKVINITGGAVKKSDIPAATQLFTTDWVVRYMVDNSLGKYYLERHPKSNIKGDLQFLLPDNIEVITDDKNLQEYSLIDNAMGSGHILIYAFDTFMKLYQEQGFSGREAAKLIIENNLYGMDIDKRAYQLAYFSLMMKFRQYDRRAFRRNLKPNLYFFEDTDDISDYFYNDLCTENKELGNEVKSILSYFSNATEIGSILKLPKIENLNELYSFVDNHQISDDLGIYNLKYVKEKALRTLELAQRLLDKYDIAVTNPPYLNKFDATFKKYVKKYYKDYSKDLFSIFIYHNANIINKNGYAAFMTPFVWMFIKSYEELRTYLLDNRKISSLIQMEYSAFEEATVPINTFVIENTRNNNSNGIYLRLSDFKGGMNVQKEKVLEAIANPDVNYLYRSNQTKFNNIPGTPIAYWASDNLISDFKNGTKIGDLVDARQGLATAKNDCFLRQWFEVSVNRISFNSQNIPESIKSNKKWFPYNKGGSYRKWYGNYDYVVNWENDGYEIRNFKDSKGKLRSRPQNTDYYFREAITWSDVNSGNFSLRFRKDGSIHDVKGMSAFGNETNLYLVLAITNTKIGNYIFNILNPTISLQVGNFKSFPILRMKSPNTFINLVKKNIHLSKNDWDSFEASWDFKRQPILSHIVEHNLSPPCVIIFFKAMCQNCVKNLIPEE